jgi:23S rRNA pseudouridine1911/1915/1917 synthase
MDITITSADSGKTIRELLRRDMGFSSAMLKKLKFSPGGITVNGGFVTVRYVLREGDVLSLDMEDKEEDTCPYMIPVELPVSVLFEDEHIVAVDKPWGMPSHPSFGHREDPVANALAFRYQGTPYVFRPVNRLDRDTSGIMLVARSRLDAWKMYSAMTGGRICKVYAALLLGVPEKEAGEHRTYMCRMEGSIVMRRVCEQWEDGAKLAVTRYKTVYAENGRALVLASPVTGRTHQLRVAFASMGCPIAGDDMYGGDMSLISRQALHSCRTSFPHPSTGETVTVTSPIPNDIIDAIHKAFPAADIDFDKVIRDTAEKWKNGSQSET